MKEPLNLPVTFSGVSIGEYTARVGVKMDRGPIDLLMADEVFCGHRLTGKVVLGGFDDSQPDLIDDLRYEVAGTFDVKRFGVTSAAISTGLTFSLPDIDVGTLAKFANGKGRLIVDEVADLPAGVDGDDEAEGAPTVHRAEGPWREVPLDTIFSGAVMKSLKGGGLDTVGAFIEFNDSESKLTDLTGIGAAKAENISDTMVAWWGANPHYCDGKNEDGTE